MRYKSKADVDSGRWFANQGEKGIAKLRDTIHQLYSDDWELLIVPRQTGTPPWKCFNRRLTGELGFFVSAERVQFEDILTYIHFVEMFHRPPSTFRKAAKSQ